MTKSKVIMRSVFVTAVSQRLPGHFPLYSWLWNIKQEAYHEYGHLRYTALAQEASLITCLNLFFFFKLRSSQSDESWLKGDEELQESFFFRKWKNWGTAPTLYKINTIYKNFLRAVSLQKGKHETENKCSGCPNLWRVLQQGKD